VIEKSPETHDDATNILVCIAFVDGVVEGISLGVRYAEEMTGKKIYHPFCIPENAGKGQLVRTALTHIRNHPEKARVPSILLVTESFTAAFPCKE